MIRMRATVPGRVEYSRVKRGGKGTSAPDVLFSYTVNGTCYDSNRFAPGFSQGCTSTGGGRAAEDFRDGQDVVVHYDPDRPYDACLAWGWNAFSFALPFFILGMGMRGYGGRVKIAGWTLLMLAIPTLFFLRGVLTPAQLPTAALAAGIALLLSWLWNR